MSHVASWCLQGDPKPIRRKVRKLGSTFSGADRLEESMMDGNGDEQKVSSVPSLWMLLFPVNLGYNEVSS